MTVVKISKKHQLDALVSKLTLRLGRKPTQQEVIDICVDLGEEYFDEIATRLVQLPKLDDAKVQKIKQMSEALRNAPWIELKRGDFANEDDADVYSL